MSHCKLVLYHLADKGSHDDASPVPPSSSIRR